MAINKVVKDGVALIDLSQDTVTSAADIVSGKKGHLQNGEQVTGTYTGIVPTGNKELTQQSGTDVANYATASVRSGSVTLNTPTINTSTGVVTASASVGTTGWVGSAPSSKTLSLTTQAAKTVTPGTSSQTAVAAGRYTTGAVTVAAVPSETKTVDLSMASGNQTVSASSGKWMTSVTVNKPATLLPENIKKDVNIGGVVGTYEGGGGGGETVTLSLTLTGTAAVRVLYTDENGEFKEVYKDYTVQQPTVLSIMKNTIFYFTYYYVDSVTSSTNVERVETRVNAWKILDNATMVLYAYGAE